MKYCITIEETKRVAIWFDADSDYDAEEKAAEINETIGSDDLSSGDCYRDYSLVNESTSRTLIDWD